jgi:protein involved in polysaccharide export with SLBB domain
MLNTLKKAILVFVLTVTAFGLAQAQIPSDLSRIKSSQITDAQLMQFVQQAQSSGMTEAELMSEFQKKGLPDVELQALAARLKGLMGSSQAIESTSDVSGGKVLSNKRTYKGDYTQFKMPEKPSRVFGSELFSGVDPIFVPNLKIATPKGYVIGAEDELQLDIYGNNISNQKLMVSPEGIINVKYAGPVNVSGMTIEQAAGVLKGRLTKFYPALSSGATKLQLTLGSVRSVQVTIVGAVKKPGTITLPSIATLFNALYSSGGPLENGSFRNIELVRNSKTIAIADLYQFILKGDQSANISLQDNDIIRVPFAQTQIVLDGQLNRNGIFEIKDKESLKEALDFAGGFRSNAFKGRITGTRFTDIERKVIDIPKEEFNSCILRHGDSLYVDSVVNRFENRVYITGAVFKPGQYSIENGLDMSGLISKAQGLKEDAFTGRANLVRIREDKTKEYLSVNLKSVINGYDKIKLKKEDSLHVVSLIEIKDKLTVNISGPVKFPGTYVYEDSMSLQSLILQAGGFLDMAITTGVEVGRRKSSFGSAEVNLTTSDIISVQLTNDLSKFGSDLLLMPFDEISIKYDPAKKKQISVLMKGQVMFEGLYTLSGPNERISSVLKRAGGLLPSADIYGARLVRVQNAIDTIQLRRFALNGVKSKNEKGDSSSLLSDLDWENTEVALNLVKAISRPGSFDDISLVDGDVLIVPKFNNTVSVSGDVLKPVTVQFDERSSFSKYISAAGGFARSASKSSAFIQYANGSSAKTTSFLGISKYPKVKPGSSIFIPQKNQGQVVDPTKAGILISALTAISTLMVLLFR